MQLHASEIAENCIAINLNSESYSRPSRYFMEGGTTVGNTNLFHIVEEFGYLVAHEIK
jgi:hypothetical protein